MFALARLHPAPRTADELRETLEGWRIAHYGDGILAAIEDAVPRRKQPANRADHS